MTSNLQLPEQEERAASVRTRLRAPLIALLLLVVTGVAAAALLRPFLGSPTAPGNRAAARRAVPGPVVSLDDLRRETARRQDDASTGPAHVATVIGVGTGQFSGSGSADSSDIVAPDGPPKAADMKAPSDAEVKSELAAMRKAIAGVDPRKCGRGAYVDGKGQAVLPCSAPTVVAKIVAAANEIATKPYKWGGGHGAWGDSGYDCSGSVSFALAGGGLLNSPLDSTGLMSYGDSGPGKWITIYANGGHTFMTVANLRFDTSGQSAAGTRWQAGSRPTDGFAVRHPPGL